MIRLILILGFLFTVNASAVTNGYVRVEGVFMGYDENTVKIDTGAQKVLVPRSAVSKIDGLESGKSTISTRVLLTEFVRVNKEN